MVEQNHSPSPGATEGEEAGVPDPPQGIQWPKDIPQGPTSSGVHHLPIVLGLSLGGHSEPNCIWLDTHDKVASGFPGMREAPSSISNTRKNIQMVAE